MFNQVNTKKQGDVGLAAAIYYFTSNNYVVSVPLTDSQDYDLIVDDGTKISRVQAKTTSYKNESGNYFVSLTIKGGNRTSIGKIKLFNKSKVDLLYILTENKEEYIIPVLELPKSSVTLCEKYLKFKCKPTD